jgi:hypothetical protein
MKKHTKAAKKLQAKKDLRRENLVPRHRIGTMSNSKDAMEMGAQLAGLVLGGISFFQVLKQGLQSPSMNPPAGPSSETIDTDAEVISSTVKK